jgi:hypothetical protein
MANLWYAVFTNFPIFSYLNYDGTFLFAGTVASKGGSNFSSDLGSEVLNFGLATHKATPNLARETAPPLLLLLYIPTPTTLIVRGETFHERTHGIAGITKLHLEAEKNGRG